MVLNELFNYLFTHDDIMTWVLMID